MNTSDSKFSDLTITIIKQNNDRYNNEIDFKINLYNFSLRFRFLNIFKIKPLNSIQEINEINIRKMIKIKK